MGRGCSSGVEHLPNLYKEGYGLSPDTWHCMKGNKGRNVHGVGLLFAIRL